MNPKIKLNIVAGFLGAGKTTLINKLLAECYAGERVAILENELGEIGIDGDLLPAGGTNIAVREILNGCVCCTLQGDFISGMKELAAAYAPDRIVIEPTGAGNLKDVVDACRIAEREAPVRLESALTVVSAPLCLIYLAALGEFYKDQIRYSPLVVLSAVQKIKPGVSLDDVRNEIRRLNPNAPVIAEAWDRIEGIAIAALAEESSISLAKSRLPGTEKQGERGHHHCHDEEGGFETCSFFIEGEAAAIESLAEKLKSGRFGEIFRAKGFIPSGGGFVKFDYVYGESEVKESAYAGKGKLAVIGKGLDAGALKKIFA